MADSTTRIKLTNVAQELMQTVGFNAFSYHDLADKIGSKPQASTTTSQRKKHLSLAVLAR